MNTRLLMMMQVTVGPVLNIGAVPSGARRTVPLNGGTFEGPRLRGTIPARQQRGLAAEPKYAFLNRLLAVGIGEIRPEGPVHLIEEIL
ncbi:MAG TPA: DUF3237 family protein [Vicinamibacterales bacterium]